MKSTQTIAASLPGFEPDNLRVDQVTAFLAELVQPVCESETLDLFQALGRSLSEDLVSPINVPPHDNSAMDGYAFDSAQLEAGQPLSLRMVGTVLAGQAWSAPLASGECLKIMTGAVLPAGLDTVVPLELVRATESLIDVPAGAVKAGDNRRLTGEDLKAGSVALQRGQALGPAAIGLIASLGIAQVRVQRRIRVAYFSTGNEILSLGEAPRTGAVFDSNRYTLCGLLHRLGVEIIDLGVVRDDPTALEAALRWAAAQADAIITSGGMSMGEADHIRELMQRLGDVVFWRVAMRPGRPMAVGQIQSLDKPVYLFGLPGNPVAAMVAFLAFVRPALLQLMGHTHSAPLPLQAVCLEALKKRPGRTEYLRGSVSRAADGRLLVRCTGAQGSGLLHSMVEANGLIVLPHDQGNVAAGETVDVLMFDGLI